MSARVEMHWRAAQPSGQTDVHADVCVSQLLIKFPWFMSSYRLEIVRKKWERRGRGRSYNARKSQLAKGGRRVENRLQSQRRGRKIRVNK